MPSFDIRHSSIINLVPVSPGWDTIVSIMDIKAIIWDYDGTLADTRHKNLNVTEKKKEFVLAKLYFRYGAMNCGKSTSLIQVDYNYRERNMNTVIIKPETDTKGSDRVISRLDVERRADILATGKDNFYLMIENWPKEKGPVHCVLVDEAQFLTHAQVDQLFEVAVIQDIPVICYGLRTDFLLNGFEGSARLLLMAHSIEELKTICKCGQKAIANGRKIGGRFVFEGAQVAIEGEASVEYESLCARCYFKYKKEYENRTSSN